VRVVEVKKKLRIHAKAFLKTYMKEFLSYEAQNCSLGLQQHQKRSNTMNSEWWRALKC